MGKKPKKTKNQRPTGNNVSNMLIDITSLNNDETKIKIAEIMKENSNLKLKMQKMEKDYNSSENDDLSSVDMSANEDQDKTEDRNKKSETVINSHNKFTELYKHTDKGPYNVICESPSIDEFKLCEIFLNFKVKDVASVTKIGKDKVRIQTKTYTAANSIIKLSAFSALKNYKIHIPNNFIHTDGIVRNIPQYYTVDKLRELINSPTPIVNIERLNFWNHTSQIAEPSTTIKITFRSSTIPQNISCMWLLRKVFLFVPKPLFCQNCLSYGHYKKFCKVPEENSLCRKCALPKHPDNTNCNPNCKQCKEAHITGNVKACKIYKQQQDIKKIMTEKKITYQEAKIQKIMENPTPAMATHGFKKTFTQIVSDDTRQSQTKSTPIPSTTANHINKQEQFIITLTKIYENSLCNQNNGPGGNDETLMNIGTHINNYWKVSQPPVPSTNQNVEST